MGVHRGDGYDLLGEDTKTWDEAGPRNTSVHHRPAGTAATVGLVSLCQACLNSGVFAVRNVPFRRVTTTVLILAEPVGPTKTHKWVQLAGPAVNGC